VDASFRRSAMGAHGGEFNSKSGAGRIVAGHDQQDAVGQRQMLARCNGDRGKAVAESFFDCIDHLGRAQATTDFVFTQVRDYGSFRHELANRFYR